ncbi:putative methyltransferase PMT14 [Glycine soja]
MGSKTNASSYRGRRPLSIFSVLSLRCFFYLLGAWQGNGSGKGDNLTLKVNNLMTDRTVLPNLSFESHGSDVEIVKLDVLKDKAFKPCDMKYTDYTPCQVQDQMKFPRENMIYRERHCTSENEKLHCLIPAHKGSTTHVPWPKSHDYAYYDNVPYKSLIVEKAVQNWFGGTMFPQGAYAYNDELASIIPIIDDSVRKALDIGCGVASWGAYLLNRNVLVITRGTCWHWCPWHHPPSIPINRIRYGPVFSMGIIDTSIEVISKGCINLKQLCLRRCCFVSDNGLVAFAKVVVSLESLMLEEHNRFTQSGIIVALTNIKIKFSLSLVKCMGVKDIDMEVSMLSPCESLRPLARLVNVNLIGYWNLTDNKITDASLVAIANNFVVLNDLDVSKCAITNVGITVLSRVSLPSLQVFSLSGCSNVSNKSAPFLMKLGHTLLGLNLQSCNSIGTNTIELLVEKLWRCHILA